MSYKIQAEAKDGAVGTTEIFSYRYFALKAAASALKNGWVVTKIEKVEDKQYEQYTREARGEDF